jgi:cation diffusion facilitator family transporter
VFGQPILDSAEPVMARHAGTLTTLLAALAGNCLVAVCKFVAAAWTGSSAMMAEGVHSLVDTANQLLLLYGLHRAERRPSREHPLGYGRELYFWSFIVALLIFSVGACAAVLEGVLHILNPRPIEDAYITYLVLALAFLFEGASWLVAVRSVAQAKGEDSYFEAFRRSRNPPSFMVLFEDSAALLGIAIAAIGTWSSLYFELPYLDGLASILIGVVLGLVAVLLAGETKSLLIGEAALPEMEQSINRLAAQDPCIVHVNGIITVHLSPDQIIATLSLEFDDHLTTSVIEQKVEELEERVRAVHPQVVALFVKPQKPARYQAMRRARFGDRAIVPDRARR